MQMRRLAIMLFCLLPMAVMLYGCGSSNKSGNGTPDTVATVGDTACVQCHGGRNSDALTGEDIIAQYNKANVAHNKAGLGCESCHGGGAQHNGVGPIPYPSPDVARCLSCHDGQTTINGMVAPASNADKYETSQHKLGSVRTGDLCRRCHTHEGAVLGSVFGVTGDMTKITTAAMQAVTNANPAGVYTAINCQTCHEHGAGLRAAYTTDAGGNKVIWDPTTATASAKKINQFALCTSCHNYLDNDAATIIATNTTFSLPRFPGDATPASITTKQFDHATTWYRTIASTHHDFPQTAFQTDNSSPLDGVPDYNVKIEGYVIRKSGNACFDCHGHEAKTNTRQNTTPQRESTIHTDWAKSAHGGRLLEAKYAAAGGETSTTNTTAVVEAVMAAGVTKTEAPGWTYYNWDDSTGTAADRKSCQRCHTATGAANYLSSPATYDPANNSFTHLSGWTTTTKTSPQQEVLYCWGCHDNAGTGSLRKPGAITANYTGSSYTYPDAKASNACISCHSGRETGESVKAATGDFSNKSFINSHYLTAGGTVFGNTGYHYTNRDYSIPAGDTHVKIGMGTTGNAAVDAAAKNGPCAACHFGSKNGSHKLKPYTVYSATDTSINPLCINCHSTRGEGTNSYVTWLGDDATAATFTGTTHKARYQAGLEALRVLLQDKGYTFTAGYPYFAAKNWLSAGDTDTTGNVTGKNNMGAAFNYNLLIHDPGGVAHNRRYTRRLIYDAMDWLDNNQLDYSVSATLAALPDPAYKAAATAYLINAGTGNVNLGTPNERH